jgi:hypothetical protein
MSLFVIPGRAPSREPGISINNLWIPGSSRKGRDAPE